MVTRLRTLLIPFGVAGALALLTVASPGLAAPHHTTPDVHLIAKKVWPDGTVSLAWRVGQRVVKYDGPAGATLSVATARENADGSGTGTAAVTVPGEDKSIPPAQLARRWAASHQSTRRDLRAVHSADAKGDIIDSWCVGWSNYSDDDVHAKTCNVRRMDWSSGANWYIVDSVKGSSYTDDGHHGDPHCFDCDTLNAFAGTMTYADTGITIVDWSPSATKPYGACKDSTTTVTSPKSGTSYSQTDTVCPEHFGPYLLSNQRTGAKWDNSGGNRIDPFNYRDVLFNDVVHSPPGTTTGSTLTQSVWWG